MDFSPVELTADDRAFLANARAFLNTHVTADVHRREAETGDSFDEAVHRALGAAGYLESEFKPEADEGFTRVRRRLWELEKRRAKAPWITWSVTAMVARAVQSNGTPELKAEVMPGVFDGSVRICLGYTEPEGGSDIATCKTRAVLDADGSSWVINGSKMFTTSAHNCQYVFLITNTDPGAPKHKSLTMFLLPLDTKGIEIQGVRTVDGDRTNITYYSDVRVDDRYRLGDVNGGWRVLSDPLNAEHGAVPAAADGLQDIAVMTNHATRMAVTVDAVAKKAACRGAGGTRLLDDRSVAQRLGRNIARVEAALSTPNIYGRVAIAQTMRDVSPELMDLQGAAGALSTAGGLDETAEYLYRWAPLTGIYGGTLEVFRNMIAQHTLGLGKPSYGAPVAGAGGR